MTTYDIYIDIQPAADSSAVPPVALEDRSFPFNFGTGSTGYSAGLYKGITKWCKCFLTAKGSDVADPDYGTAIGQALGGTLELDGLTDLAALAARDATNKLFEYQNVMDDPAEDELITSASILELYQDGGDGLIMSIRFTNAAGTTVDTSIAPLKITVVGG
jgi:hypothetical protein